MSYSDKTSRAVKTRDECSECAIFERVEGAPIHWVICVAAYSELFPESPVPELDKRTLYWQPRDLHWRHSRTHLREANEGKRVAEDELTY